MSVNRSEIDFKNLKRVIISGCDEYLKYQENQGVIFSVLSFFNSNVGLTRANKVLLSIQRIPDYEHSDLLCFVMALFKTKSKKLIEFISKKIINGEVGIFDHHAFGVVIKVSICDLSSDIFSADIINIIKSKAILLRNTSYDSNYIFNKRDGIEWIFERIYLEQDEKGLVQTYLDYLENHNDLSVVERFNIQNLFSPGPM